jgi:hypothetical protein
VTPHPTLLVALSSPHIPDSGASHILLRSSSLPSLSHLFTPSPVPPISLPHADGRPLTTTSGGTISFPNRRPLLTYVVPSSALAHNVWSVSALIGTDGHALFTPTTVSFFSSASSSQPFLLGSKLPHHTLWSLDIPSPIPCTLHASAPCNPQLSLKQFPFRVFACSYFFFLYVPSYFFYTCTR